MAKIIWSPSSLNDLKQIHEYISNDSPNQANKFINKIINYAEQIIDFPKIGNVVKEFNNDNIREITYKPYRIIYRIVSKLEIRILGVIRGARDWKPDNK